MYAEASAPQHLGDKARLYSPAVTVTTPTCMTFWYSMYGDHVANLTVYTKQGATMTAVWQRSGTQGANWIKGQVGVNVTGSINVSVSQTFIKYQKL